MMDPTQSEHSGGGQPEGEQAAASEPIEEWNAAPTERHLDRRADGAGEQSPAAAYARQQTYGEERPPAPGSYGRVVDPSLPLGQERRGERQAWQGGGERERRRRSPWLMLAGGCLAVVALVTVVCAVVVGSVVSLTHDVVSVTRLDSRTFSVDGPATVTVRVPAGNVRVVSGETDRVRVELHKEVSAISRDLAQQSLDAITLDVTKSGNVLTIDVNEPSLQEIGHFLRQVDLTITTPATTNVDATVAAGNLTMRGLSGTLAADLSAGNLSIENVTVPGVAVLNIEAGNMELVNVSGGLKATSSFGNMKLTDTTLTQNSTIRNSAGNINFDGTLRTGASLDVTDHAGNISMTLPQQTNARLDATTSAGRISVVGWPGVGEVSSGAASSVKGDLSPNPAGTIHVHVDTGNITIMGQ